VPARTALNTAIDWMMRQRFNVAAPTPEMGDARTPYQHPAIFADVYKKPYGILWSHYRAGEDATLYNAEMASVIRGEAPMQGTLQDLERRLNALVETGPGENPFKGLTWPIQPK
jgi:hypothetical protein